MRKTFVWFDLGYTLFYQQREITYQKYLQEKYLEVPYLQIEEAYHFADKLFMREYPGILSQATETFYPWYLGIVNYQLGLHFDLLEQNHKIQTWIKEKSDYWSPYPFTHSILQQLKTENYKIGLISNWDLSARDLLKRNGLLPYFDTVVISSEVGVSKPDPGIFYTALKLANATAEESIYVGDNYYDDVITSLNVGIDCVLINRFGQKGIEEIAHDSIIFSIKELPPLLKGKNWTVSAI
ncbi:HAD family hydrolase [Neobacillus sp. LXY-1]|uniref:HAD family hydrolase n=1 Tax=Neobacillus sp. LXY-1 TaxID=3379133 RepID=UPI003EE12FD7